MGWEEKKELSLLGLSEVKYPQQGRGRLGKEPINGEVQLSYWASASVFLQPELFLGTFRFAPTLRELMNYVWLMFVRKDQSRIFWSITFPLMGSLHGSTLGKYFDVYFLLSFVTLFLIFYLFKHICHCLLQKRLALSRGLTIIQKCHILSQRSLTFFPMLHYPLSLMLPLVQIASVAGGWPRGQRIWEKDRKQTLPLAPVLSLQPRYKLLRQWYQCPFVFVSR